MWAWHRWGWGTQEATPGIQHPSPFRKRLANDQIEDMKKLALCAWDIVGAIQQMIDIVDSMA